MRGTPNGYSLSMADEEIRKAARKSLKAKAEFKNFVAVAIIVSLIVTGVWYLTTGGTGYFWPVWPMLGLAIALAFTWLNAYGPTSRITESAIDAEVARLQRKSGDA